MLSSKEALIKEIWRLPTKLLGTLLASNYPPLLSSFPLLWTSSLNIPRWVFILFSNTPTLTSKQPSREKHFSFWHFINKKLWTLRFSRLFNHKVYFRSLVWEIHEINEKQLRCSIIALLMFVVILSIDVHSLNSGNFGWECLVFWWRVS